MGSVLCQSQDMHTWECHIQRALRHVRNSRDCTPEIAVETFQLDQTGGNVVVCFLELCDTEHNDAMLRELISPGHVESLRRQLKETLPAHLIPGTFVPVEKLPRTAIGTIDRPCLQRTAASIFWFPFWETSLLHNTWERTESYVETFGDGVSSLLVGDSNKGLRTKPIDILLGALICTFSKAFPDRSLPPLFTESREDGHSTESKYLSISPAPGITPVEAVMTAKDARCGVQTLPSMHAVGHPELFLKFTRISSDEGQCQNQASDQMETPPLRVALIQFEAAVEHGQMVLSIHFPKDTKHQLTLRNWVQALIQAVNSIAYELSHMSSTFTKSDFPLIDLSYRGLKILQEEQLPRMGVEPVDVVNICPCSPLQEGVLLSSSSYATYWIWRCVLHHDRRIDINRLETAWKTVVSQHKIFSTIFGHHPEKAGFVQIVLGNPDVRVSQMVIPSGCSATALSKMERPSFGAHEPKHMFTICQSGNGEISCRLDICHTIFDYSSLAMLLQDVVDVYGGRIPPVPPPFSQFVEHITSKPESETIQFWIKFLRDAKPCLFPVLRSSPASEMEDIHDVVSIPRECLGRATQFCRENGINRSTFIHIAWGLVLSYFTGADEACFGYMVSGRDAPVEGIKRIFGPLANMVMSRIDLRKPLKTLLEATGAMLKEHRRHQQISLAEVQHRLGIPGGRLFNTMISLLRADTPKNNENDAFSFQKHEAVSPQEFDLVIEGFLNPDSTDLCIYYRKAFINREVAEEVSVALVWAANYLVSQESYLRGETTPLTQGCSSEPCDIGATESLPESFFKYVVGADLPSTKRFWEGQFAGYKTAGPQPLKDLAAPIPKKEYLVIESDDLELDSSFPAEVRARASWALVMAQTEDSHNVSFGTNIRGQPKIQEIRTLKGTDQNILPMQVTIDWNITPSQFLRDLHRQMQEVSKYEGAGLHWIRQIGTEAYSACTLPSLVVFRSNNASKEGEDSIDNIAPIALWGYDSTSLECQLVKKKLRTRIGFNPNIMTELQSTRLSRRFQHVFRQLSNREIEEQTLKDAMDICHRDLADIWQWNANVPKPAKVCIHDLIRSRVLLHPDKTAICAWNGNLTYGQLDDLSTRLAHRLIRLDIGQGDIVPLFFEKSMWMPVAMLGIIKTGAAALGLDPKQPKERLHTISKQVNPRLALCSKNNKDLAFSAAQCDVEIIDAESLAEITVKRGQWLPEVDPSGILYMVFTSGSTGTPKGVLIPHESYSSAVVNQPGVWGINETSRIFDFSSYAFDALWFNLLHTLTSGGCVCVPSDEEIQNSLSASIEKYDVTISFLTPSVARHIEPKALGRLETVLLGGEMVHPEDLSSFSKKTQIKIIYGPSECTPMTTCHDIGHDRSIAIGRGYAVCTWIVNPEPPYDLTPIGMVGELWLEGPVTGQGYFNDVDKTAASFITDPEWLTKGNSEHPGRGGRVYRTGDLVRYRDDGTLIYVGRKDTQVKIRGQRLELSEVEKHVQVLLQPRKIHGEGFQVVAETIRPKETNNLMLIVFVCLVKAENYTEKEHAILVQTATSGLVDSLSKIVPAYMVPNAIIPIHRVPVNINGKTDRSQLRHIGVSSWRTHAVVSDEGDTDQPSTEMERLLQQVWMSVLNLPAEAISVKKPFTRLGGDSITAMQVVSECRSRNVSVTVGDILRAQTLEKIAPRCSITSANTSRTLVEDDEDTCQPFSLSPIQRKYFAMFPEGINHFNQSFILTLNHSVPSTSIHNALKAVVHRHAMLRARYRKSTKGNWEQYYSQDAEPFSFVEHVVADRSEVLDIAQDRQVKMDTTNGPVFGADLFHVRDSNQMLLLSAHHLVVDLVSWRIIWNDIEENIRSGHLRSYTAPSFRSWCKLQSRMPEDLEPNTVLPFNIAKPDYAFWDMSSTPNIRSEAEDCVKTLDRHTTELLLGNSNRALRTEVLDIIVGSYAYSFQKSFLERTMPAIFVEGHGREQSENLAMDVSGTVGWFTTMHPLPIEITPDATIIDAVRVAKDIRRKVPGKGQPYFASRYYSETCRERFKDHDSVELLLNFAGRYQQLESEDALFKLADPFENGRMLEVVAPSSSRMALIELNMAVQDGKLTVTFTFNTKMKHQDRLRRWFQDFMDTLHLSAYSLQQEPASFTLADFDLLPISYNGLERLMTEQLQDMHLKPSDIVDIYQASPLQEGILLSSHKGISSYATFWIWKCASAAEPRRVSASQLEAAWRAVVKRHSVLSTVFGPHPEGNGFIQILLADPETKVTQINTESGDPCEMLGRIKSPRFATNEPEHMFTICEAGGEVACRLDINHTLVDGGSLTPLVQDIVAAYDQCTRPSAPSFKEMMQYLRKTDQQQITSFWVKYLEGTKPCEVPVSAKSAGQDAEDTFRYISIPSQSMSAILEFCKHTGITRAVFLQVAWAMVLSQLTGMQEVCFGYLASGRNAQIDGVENLVGPLANMLVSRIDLRAAATDVLQTTSKNSIEHLGHQHASLAEVQHKIGLSGRRLFNTAMTVRQEDRFGSDENRTLSLEYHSHQDPHEFDLLLSSRIENDNMDVSIQIREASVSRQLAEETAVTLERAMNYLLKSGPGCESLAAPTSLYHGFFIDIVGRDENYTLAFWKDYFTGLDVNCFPPLKTPQVRAMQVKEVSSRVSELHLKDSDFTPTVTAGAAWSIVAATNAGSSEALFGTILETSEKARRARCVLPIRSKLLWDGDGNALLKHVKEGMSAMQVFESLSSQLVARASDEAATASKFQALLVVDDNRRTEQAEILGNQNTYSLVIYCLFGDNDAVLTLKYDTAVLSEVYARRIANQLEQALCWLSSAELRENNLRDAIAINSKELEQIWTWNKFVPKAVHYCMHELIHDRAGLTPDAPAICAWDGNLTYNQLDKLSTSLAHHLLSYGIGSGHIVPLCFEKSMWAPVAMLGVMKTGAASVMMDVTQPEERLKIIANEVDCHVTLSSKSNQDLARRIGVKDLVIVNAEEIEALKAPDDDELPTADPSDVIYAVFTSGSTGKPKGTFLSHRNMSSMVIYQQQALGISSTSRVFDFASYAFDVSWGNFLHALTSGGCLCIPSESDRKENIEASINALRANYAHITPTLLRYLDWSKLRTITVLNLSGEAVSARDKSIAGPNVRIINAYGPAETNVVCIQDLSALPGDEVSIGCGAGACTWVVDDKDANCLAPIGTVGELWIEGPLVGLGYLKDDQRTAAAFVSDPAWLLSGSTNHPGRKGRLYRTGDLVRYKDDGSLEYVGRKDTQVKIRGQRVELGEVETYIRQALERDDSDLKKHSSDCRIIADTIQPRGSATEMLVAFVCLAGSGNMTADVRSSLVHRVTERISTCLSKVLPAYSIPSAYIPMRDVPLTATGKTDRRKLKEMGASKTVEEIAALGQSNNTRRKPTTQAESLLQKLWARVLNIEPDSIGIDDNFFRVGGDSIGAMKLVSLARDHKLSVTVQDIFQKPVLHRLSSLIAAKSSTRLQMIAPFSLLKPGTDRTNVIAAVASLCRVKENKVADILPCTTLQETLLSRSGGEIGPLMSRHVMEIHQGVDMERFRDVWNQVVSRNPIMRTRIVYIPGQGHVQVILDDTIEWFTGKSLDECMKHSLEHPMGQGLPLAKLGVVQPESSRRDFVWEMHWALYDGWSLRLLLAEAEKIYFNTTTRPLEGVAAFTKYIHDRNKKEAMLFWRRQFANLQGSHFPPNVPTTCRPRIDSEVSVVAPDVQESDGEYTAATIVRAALSLVIAQNLTSNEAIFGATVTGRQAAVPGIELMAGPAFATLPIRVSIDWSMTARELLEMVHTQAADMIPFEQTSLEQIRQASDEAASACNFQTLLVVQSAIKQGDFRSRDETKELFVKGLVAGKGAIVELGQRSGEYSMFVECQLGVDGDMKLRVCFDSAILRPALAEKIIGQLERTIKRLSNAGEQISVKELMQSGSR